MVEVVVRVVVVEVDLTVVEYVGEHILVVEIEIVELVHIVPEVEMVVMDYKLMLELVRLMNTMVLVEVVPLVNLATVMVLIAEYLSLKVLWDQDNMVEEEDLVGKIMEVQLMPLRVFS